MTCRVDNARKKMRPDMMVVEMTDSEQHIYLPHDTDAGLRLPNLQPTMPSGKARKIITVEGGYCSDVSYLEKSQGERTTTCQAGGSTEAIYGYDVTSLTSVAPLGHSRKAATTPYLN